MNRTGIIIATVLTKGVASVTPQTGYNTGSTYKPPLAVIPFTSTATPTITGYQTTYAAIYGEYPVIECWLIDGTTRTQLMQPPIITTSAGLIDTISFDLGFINTGIMILR